MPPTKRKRKRKPFTAPKKKRKIVKTESSHHENSSEDDVPVLRLKKPVYGFGKNGGRKYTLTPEVERKLYKLAKHRGELGMTRAQYLDVVGEVADGLDMPFSKGVPGNHWYSAMMARHTKKPEDEEEESSDEESSQNSSSEKVEEAIEDAIENFRLQKEEKNKSKKRSSYGLYSEQDMLKAVEAVNSGEMRLHGASKYYNVPRSTLRDRVSGVHPSGSKAGNKRVLSDEVEKDLFSLAKKRGKLGLTTPDFLEIAGELAAEKKTPFPNGRPSMNWFRQMLKRNETTSVRDSDSENSSDENDKLRKYVSRGRIKKRRKLTNKKGPVGGAKKMTRKHVGNESCENDNSDTSDSNASFENDSSVENDSSSENNSSFESNVSGENRPSFETNVCNDVRPSVDTTSDSVVFGHRYVHEGKKNTLQESDHSSQENGDISVENRLSVNENRIASVIEAIKSENNESQETVYVPVTESCIALPVEFIKSESGELHQVIHLPVTSAEETVTLNAGTLISDSDTIVMIVQPHDGSIVEVAHEVEVSNAYM